MTTSLDPEFIDALRDGNLSKSQQYIAEQISLIRELPVFDIFVRFLNENIVESYIYIQMKT